LSDPWRRRSPSVSQGLVSRSRSQRSGLGLGLEGLGLGLGLVGPGLVNIPALGRRERCVWRTTF